MPLSAAYHGHGTYSIAVGATGTVLTVPAGAYGDYPYIVVAHAVNGYTSGVVPDGTLTIVYSGGTATLPAIASGTRPWYLLDTFSAFPLASGWANAGFIVQRHPTSAIFTNPERGVLTLALIAGVPPLGILATQGTEVTDNAQDVTNPHTASINISFLPGRTVIGTIGAAVLWRTPTTGVSPSWASDTNWSDIDVGVNTVSSADAAVSIGLMASPPSSLYTSYTLSNLPTAPVRDTYAVSAILTGTITARGHSQGQVIG